MLTRSRKQETKKRKQSSSEDEDEKVEYDNKDNQSSNSNSDNECDDYYGYTRTLKRIKKKDKDAYHVLDKTLKKMKDKEPSLMRILKSKILMQDRIKLIDLFYIYDDVPPCTEYKITLRDRLDKMLRDAKVNYNMYHKYNSAEHKRMKREEKLLSEIDTDYTLKYKILNLNTSTENKAIIYKKYKQYEEDQEDEGGNEEVCKLRNWLHFVISLPHDNMKGFNFKGMDIPQFLAHVKEHLDKELYGMENVKEQLLLFLNSRFTNPNMKKCSLALVGPPGTGKSKIAHLLADVLQHPFTTVSFGGVTKSDFLKGHDYTYLGSTPGSIAKSLVKLKCKDGIILFDEYDKISEFPEVRDAVLEITDPLQNLTFRDNYLYEITLDLSQLFIIYTMNQVSTDIENEARMDRLYIIQVQGYTNYEKSIIAKNCIFTRTLQNINKSKKDIILTQEIAEYLVNKTCPTNSKGIRQLERSIEDLIYKINFLICNQNENGKLKIKVSFDLNKKLKYPVELTRELIDKLLIKSGKDEGWLDMFI